MGEAHGQQDADQRTREAIRALFRAMSDSYPERHTAMKGLDELFRTEMAAALQPSLNAYLATTPQNTINDKQAIATRLNADLHALHLRAKCPKSGRPSALVATYRDAKHMHLNYFKYESRDHRGKESRIIADGSPLELELMADPPRSEAFARHYGPRRGDSPQR